MTPELQRLWRMLPAVMRVAIEEDMLPGAIEVWMNADETTRAQMLAKHRVKLERRIRKHKIQRIHGMYWRMEVEDGGWKTWLIKVQEEEIFVWTTAWEYLGPRALTWPLIARLLRAIG